jgi:hypothetical protein
MIWEGKGRGKKRERENRWIEGEREEELEAGWSVFLLFIF